MERFFKNLREFTTKINNCEKMKMIPQTYDNNESNSIQTICHISKKQLEENDGKKL